MDIIAFGTGKAGKDSMPFLKQNNRILFFVDNNENKWGSMFETYNVKSPNEINNYKCDIVITSTRYSMDIIEQLKKMGISCDRIYICRKFRVNDSYEYEIYPIIEEKLPCGEKKLIYYDLCHLEEKETRGRKILLFCSFFSVYTKQLIENIEKRFDDVEFSLLTGDKEYKEKIASERLKHIYYYHTMSDLKAILEQLPVYDAMQLLWIEREWAYFYQLIRRRTRKLNLNVGGSDFYRATDAEKNYKRNLIACADHVTAETIETIQAFEKYYDGDIKNKLGLLPFGLEILDLINYERTVSKDLIREKYHIPSNKIIITCGHNASEAHQHIKLIEALNNMSENIKKQLVFVFPMTYPKGKEIYINIVNKKLEESELDYLILTEFMDFKAMAEYALISDIMIHVQTTDQLSSTMLEEMYAGSIVIAGKWLPYKSLHDRGLFFFDVDDISDITISLEKVVVDIKKYKKNCVGNKDIIWDHSSWEKLAPKWYDLWS